MKKFLIAVFCVLVVSCGRFPTASEYWTKDGKWPGYEIVQDEMYACGYTNTWNPNLDMSREERLKAHLCMEKKGYLFDNQPICMWRAYKNTPICVDLENK